MFDRIFRSAMTASAGILFIASLMMLAAGIGHAAYVLANKGVTEPSLSQQVGWTWALLVIAYNAFGPAAYFFAASAVVHQLDRWATNSAKG